MRIMITMDFSMVFAGEKRDKVTMNYIQVLI